MPAAQAAAGSRRAIVTGTGGLGFEVAVALAQAGTTVILAGRNRAKGAEAVADITARAPGARIVFESLDLASLASIAAFAERMAGAGLPIDLLVNNAGIMSPPQRRLTDDGFERCCQSDGNLSPIGASRQARESLRPRDSATPPARRSGVPCMSVDQRGGVRS